MKVYELFEAEYKPFSSFTVEGVEFSDGNEGHPPPSTTDVFAQIVYKKNALAKTIYELFHAGVQSTEHRKKIFVHWVTDEGKYLTILVNGRVKPAVDSLKKFLTSFISEEKKVAEPKTSKSKPIPKMKVPGVKVSMLESWRSKLAAAVKKLGFTIDGQGHEDGSTTWSVAFTIDKKFNIVEFEDKLRDELNFSGWMSVKFFDLAED